VYDYDEDYDVCYENEFFQGQLGHNCPNQDKKSTKALPTCFSGANIVEIHEKGFVTMDSLKIGDLVKTGMNEEGKTQFLPILSFMHVDLYTEVDFLQIFTSFSPSVPLEISGDHFLYLHNNKAVRAKDVEVSNILKGDNTNMVVTHIKTIKRQGLYAPATENGKIWVSGVTASSYVSLIDEGVVSNNMQVVLSHMALSPLRMVCEFGSFSICETESYSEYGYSMNLWCLIQFGRYFSTLTELLKLWMLVAVAPLLFVVGGMEYVLHHGMWASVLTVGLVVTISTIKTIMNVKMAKK
jgi:hypothetical protein